MATMSPLDRLRQLGGKLYLDGETVRYSIPADNPEAREILEDLRRNRDVVATMIRDQENKPPSLKEVKAMIPSGVRLLSYHPNQSPFAVTASVSIVSDAGLFFRTYMRDLRWRIEHPDVCCPPPLVDILAKLGDAGLELKLEGTGTPAGNIARALPERG